jgi:hypothetical protein
VDEIFVARSRRYFFFTKRNFRDGSSMDGKATNLWIHTQLLSQRRMGCANTKEAQGDQAPAVLATENAEVAVAPAADGAGASPEDAAAQPTRESPGGRMSVLGLNNGIFKQDDQE